MNASELAWDRLEPLFHRACRLPLSQREGFARECTGDDPVLLQELLAMLAVEAQATQRLGGRLRDAKAALRASSPELPAGTRFGAWATDRLIGIGGMGQVYLGRRADGAFERDVAIKLVAVDALDARTRAFFDFECRLLARMSHPSIAQIHDAGTDAQGRPYLVMEYIHGYPITTWCESRRWPLRQRVELLVAVCEGVQHAHQKGVVHRDLKPGNVLVEEIDGRPVPHIIDFGMAVTAKDPAGGAGAGGTPGYMSPEQARGDPDIDVRSDVYAMGTLLYEMICGFPPVTGLPPKPVTPSNMIAAMPKAQRLWRLDALRVNPRTLRRELRGGLDAIIGQAMCADREHRYGSMSQLVDDIRRWLDRRVPRAQPRDRWLRISACICRNQAAVLGGALVGLVVAIGLGLSLWTASIASRDAVHAGQTSQFISSLLSKIDPAVADNLDKRLMLEVMDETSRRASRELVNQPRARANVEISIAQGLQGLGYRDAAARHLERARELLAGVASRDWSRIHSLQAQLDAAATAVAPHLEGALAPSVSDATATATANLPDASEDGSYAVPNVVMPQ